MSNDPCTAAPSGGKGEMAADPIGRLSKCHRRIEVEAKNLRELTSRRGRSSIDDAARASAASVLRYFDTVAIDHHFDEEADLFPALIESMAGSDAVCLHQLVDGLIAEHRELDAGWQRLREPLKAIAEGHPADLPETAVTQWLSLYEQHLAREDQELLPIAARLIDDATLARVGESMQARHRARYGDGPKR